ncbi:MAG: carbon-nitrogen hydrolase family protein [Saprospiraceae bacterium]|nr:carbon-nitrogen hydrolase family protein [Saprospiraceae bacterium]
MMRVCAAQIHSIPGDINANLQKHVKAIELGAFHGCDLIFFPELSLTGYEPTLSKALAFDVESPKLDLFQNLSDTHKMTLLMGAPTKQNQDIFISMFIFQAGKPRLCYSKQFLHADELPYFNAGQESVFLQTNDQIIAPAIYYESLLPHHAETAFNAGAHIYLASVAKSEKGIRKAYEHYPGIAQKYRLTVLMSNVVGPCEDFMAGGSSAVWNHHGILIDHLGPEEVGLLIYNTLTEEIRKVYL